MMILIFLSITSIAFGSVEDINNYDSVMGWFGSESQCAQTSPEELETLSRQCKLSNGNKSLLEIENTMEEVIFQQVAKNSDEATQCHARFLNGYFKDPKLASELQQVAFDEFQRVQPVMSELVKMRTSLIEKKRKLMLGTAPGEKGNSARYFFKKENEVDEEINAVNYALKSMAAQVPMGGRDEMIELLVGMASEPNMTSEKFNRNFNDGMTKAKNNINKSVAYFGDRRKKNGTYNLSSNDKAALTSSGQALAYVDSYGEKLANGLQCRLKSRYVKGPANAELAATVGLTFGGGASLLGKSLWLAKGAKATSTVARIGYIGIEALGWASAAGSIGLLAEQIRKTCFNPEFFASAQNKSCEPTTQLQGIFVEASTAECTTNVIFASVPALIGLRAVLKLAKTRPPTSLSAGDSKDVRIFKTEAADDLKNRPPSQSPELAATVSANEKKLAGIIGEMNEIKKSPLTAESKKRLNDLNNEALEIVGKELDKQGIKYRIESPSIGGTPAKLRESSSIMIDARLKNAKEYLEKAKADLNSTNELLKKSAASRIFENEEKLKILQRLKEEMSALPDEYFTNTGMIQRSQDNTTREIRVLKEFKIAAEAELPKASAIERQRITERIKIYEKELDDAEKRLQMELKFFAESKPKPSAAPAEAKPVVLTDTKMLGTLHSLFSRQLVIESGPNNPKVLQNIIDKYNVKIVVSPQMKSLEQNMLGGVIPGEKPTFLYPVEEILSGNTALNGTLLHETTHLRHLQMRAQGVDLPYYIDVKAAKGMKLHTQNGFYDEFMSFDELSTWNKDLNYVDSKTLGGQVKRAYIDGRIEQQTGSSGVRYRTAKGLKILSESALEATQSARTAMSKSPEKLVFRISDDPKKPSTVTVPYLRDGNPVGTIDVTLIKLNSQNAADRMKVLKEYLDRAEKIAKFHKQKAEDALSKYSGAPTEGGWQPVYSPETKSTPTN